MSHIAFQKRTAGQNNSEKKTDVKLHEQNTREGWRTRSVKLQHLSELGKMGQFKDAGLCYSGTEENKKRPYYLPPPSQLPFPLKKTNKTQKQPHEKRANVYRCCSLGQLENLEHHQAPAPIRNGGTPNFPWQGTPANPPEPKLG